MAAALQQAIVISLVIATTSVYAARLSRFDDDIDLGLRTGGMLKMLREMANQTNATAADTLNLPANASSIRENITDTFSCENRTYGYYADVDNECQVFHVCLTSQTSTGRNVTRRWSFICPKETIFNQEVLTCTRPEDSIDCVDSPMYYDRNNDIGKTNDTSSDNSTTAATVMRNKPNNNVVTNSRRKEANKKKQNIVMIEEMTAGSEAEEMMPNEMMKKKEVKRKENIAMVENMMKEDEREGMMANGMSIDDTNTDKSMEIIVNDAINRMQNTFMTNAMLMGSMKEPMMNINDMIEANKEGDSKKPNGMKKDGPMKIVMTESSNKENSLIHDITKHDKKKEDIYKKPMTDSTNEMNIIKTEKMKEETMDVEQIDMRQDAKPLVEAVVSDFGTSNEGDKVKDPMDIMNERMALERTLKRNGKRIKKRGSFRFKADT